MCQCTSLAKNNPMTKTSSSKLKRERVIIPRSCAKARIILNQRTRELLVTTKKLYVQPHRPSCLIGLHETLNRHHLAYI